MASQPILIHGTRCLLQSTGGVLKSYVVTTPTGTVIAQQHARFIAIAKAAEALRKAKL